MELFVCLIANVMPKTRVKMLTLNSASSTVLLTFETFNFLRLPMRTIVSCEGGNISHMIRAEYNFDLRHYTGNQTNKQLDVIEREPSCSIVLQLAVT
jgi:hypothetical protein